MGTSAGVAGMGGVSKMSFMEKLLDGVEVEWKVLAEVVKIKNGKDWKSLGDGDIPVFSRSHAPAWERIPDLNNA